MSPTPLEAIRPGATHRWSTDHVEPWLWPFYLILGVLLAIVYITSKRSDPDRYSS